MTLARLLNFRYIPYAGCETGMCKRKLKVISKVFPVYFRSKARSSARFRAMACLFSGHRLGRLKVIAIGMNITDKLCP